MTATSVPVAARVVATPSGVAAARSSTRYALAEIRRVLRNTQYLVFAVGMPLVLLLVFGSTDDGSTLDGLHTGPYIMVSMATFGALSAVFSTGGRIAQERFTGWHRQLRLTSLTGRQYVVAKALSGFAVAVPSLVAVFALAAVVDDVRLPAARWPVLGLTVLVSLAPVAALGIFLGFTARTENLQAVAGGVVSLLALLGGLWLPLGLFPGWVQGIAELLPVAWVAEAGRRAVQGQVVGWHGVAVLLFWTLVLGALAARAHERDAARG